VEKYTAENHPRKKKILPTILNHDQIKYLVIHPTGQPDLLVYLPDGSDFFFIEVKGGKDCLTEKRKNVF
jgi:hypothetical protein